LTEELPAPPVPQSTDLRDFDWMPLDVVRLRDSETAMRTKGDEFRCAVLLWCAAWHQVPAASLPDDDVQLASLAGFGREVKAWKRVRAGALRGFQLCSDGRLYHLVVAEKALTSFVAKLQQRHKVECARITKWNQRHKAEQQQIPTFDLWITSTCPEVMAYLSKGQRRVVHEDTPAMSAGQPPNVLGNSGPSEVKRSSSYQSSPMVDTSQQPPGQRAGTSTPEARSRSGHTGPWRYDAKACDRKMRELGLKPGKGELLAECIRRVEQELARIDRERSQGAQAA
jgi:hypothetical protein